MVLVVNDCDVQYWSMNRRECKWTKQKKGIDAKLHVTGMLWICLCSKTSLTCCWKWIYFRCVHGEWEKKPNRMWRMREIHKWKVYIEKPITRNSIISSLFPKNCWWHFIAQKKLEEPNKTEKKETNFPKKKQDKEHRHEHQMSVLWVGKLQILTMYLYSKPLGSSGARTNRERKKKNRDTTHCSSTSTDKFFVWVSSRNRAQFSVPYTIHRVLVFVSYIQSHTHTHSVV